MRGVELFMAPWVSGTHASRYFGPVMIERIVLDPCDHAVAWYEAELWLLERIKVSAFLLGANAVIGLEITLDPFWQKGDQTGLRLHALGTAARLERLA